MSEEHSNVEHRRNVKNKPVGSCLSSLLFHLIWSRYFERKTRPVIQQQLVVIFSFNLDFSLEKYLLTSHFFSYHFFIFLSIDSRSSCEVIIRVFQKKKMTENHSSLSFFLCSFLIRAKKIIVVFFFFFYVDEMSEWWVQTFALKIDSRQDKRHRYTGQRNDWDSLSFGAMFEIDEENFQLCVDFFRLKNHLKKHHERSIKFQLVVFDVSEMKKKRSEWKGYHCQLISINK